MARYKARNFSKIRQDLPNLFFSFKSLKSEKISLKLFLTILKVAFAASTL